MIREISKVIAGFLGAPLVSGFLWGLMTLNPFGIFFSLIFAYPFAWILGIPSYLIFRRLGWLKFWQVVLTGALLGAVSFAIFYGMGTPGELNIGDMLFIGIFIVHGATVSASFWFIAIKPRKFELAHLSASGRKQPSISDLLGDSVNEDTRKKGI